MPKAEPRLHDCRHSMQSHYIIKATGELGCDDCDDIRAARQARWGEAEVVISNLEAERDYARGVAVRVATSQETEHDVAALSQWRRDALEAADAAS